jgi:hypothetical protein
MDELSAFDYTQQMEDRRCTRLVAAGYYDGGCTCVPGEGKQMTYREFLGEGFFEDLAELRLLGVQRIIFGFDN